MGEVKGLIGLALLIVAFWRKILLEETRLRAHFDTYDDYCSQTAAVIPGVL